MVEYKFNMKQTPDEFDGRWVHEKVISMLYHVMSQDLSNHVIEADMYRNRIVLAERLSADTLLAFSKYLNIQEVDYVKEFKAEIVTFLAGMYPRTVQTDKLSHLRHMITDIIERVEEA